MSYPYTTAQQQHRSFSQPTHGHVSRWPEDRNFPDAEASFSRHHDRDYRTSLAAQSGDRTWNEGEPYRFGQPQGPADDRDGIYTKSRGYRNLTHNRSDREREYNQGQSSRAGLHADPNSVKDRFTYDRSRNTYTPPHQRTVFPPLPPHDIPPFPPSLPTLLPRRPLSPSKSGFASQSRQLSSQADRPPFRRDRTVTPPPVTLPSTDYLALLRPTKPLKDNIPVPKLLVLDLNGALVFRNRSSDGKKSYPRPYLSCFLEYLFLPTNEERAWEVFVWSSAQPHNVRGMVENAFGPRFIDGVWEEETERGRIAREAGEGRLLGVWARDKMGLGASDYSRKVQTTKDLRKVLDHVQYLTPPRDFDERTIVLLDDSPLKAIYQPFNQIVIPEYGKEEYSDSKSVAGLVDAGVGSEQDGMDRTLLAVIGVLDDLRNINNVPAWVRSGGLINSTNQVAKDTKLEDLPSHDQFKHWFKDPSVLQSWIEKGETALNRRGILLSHGITPEQTSRQSKGSSPTRKDLSPARSHNRRGYHTSIGIDEDELPDLRPMDVAKYLDDLISGTTVLTLKQKDSLRLAREVLSDLDSDGQHHLSHNSIQELAVPKSIANHTPPTQARKANGSKKGEVFKDAFQLAKESNPDLTKKKFRAMRKEGRENGQAAQAEKDEETEDDLEDELEEISPAKFYQSHDTEAPPIGANEIDRERSRRNHRSGISSTSVERERDEVSKKLRSDSWSG
ncbi:uncharacterized protein IL334_002397 [Kwoniella shivajii]|uniref:FCP1 homology domain-containing protein n=1 Tax=Kwoniella shivajii TaxID=564305 RepID=A0ABZ1CUN4_9TREE|nr:hypothetical protein IL334_002397 [Kwoniella shivajii]